MESASAETESATRSGRPPRVHVTGPIPRRVTEELLASFELVPAPEEADGVLALIDAPIDERYLARAGSQLKIVANYGAGVDNVDLAAAARRDVVVTNTPGVVTQATAELALALMLTLLRRVAEGDRFVRSGASWGFSLEFMLGESLSGKTVAIVGPGRIGKETGRLVELLGARALYVGRKDNLESGLLAADVVSLHCPLTPATRHLIGEAALRQMRPTSVLVNTARGAIVDEVALARALAAGVIAGAALDVHEFEPRVTRELLAFDNVVLTPHLGSATRAARDAMGLVAVEALRTVLLDGSSPRTRVV